MKRLSFGCVFPFVLAAALALAPGPARADGSGYGLHEPEFLFHIMGTGTYALPGPQADIFFHLGKWYRRSGSGWAVSATFGGPWGFITLGSVPEVLVRLPVDYRFRYRIAPVPYRTVIPAPRRVIRRPDYYRPKYDGRHWYRPHRHWKHKGRRHYNHGPPAWSAGHRHRTDRHDGRFEYRDGGRRRR